MGRFLFEAFKANQDLIMYNLQAMNLNLVEGSNGNLSEFHINLHHLCVL